MGSDQSTPRRDERHISAHIGNYNSQAQTAPNARPQSRRQQTCVITGMTPRQANVTAATTLQGQSSRVQRDYLSSPQQNADLRATCTPNRIYPNLEPQIPPTTNSTLDFYQRHLPQNSQRYAPSAPAEDIVNSNVQPTPATTATNQQSRPRRHPHPQPNNPKNSINCPTCEKPYGVRIYQCLGGHSCCEDCKLQLKTCRLCGQSIGAMRNFALEECIAAVKVPCPNKDKGCSLHFKTMDLDSHLSECPFMVRKCPLQMMKQTTCQWEGKLSELSAHFDVVHPDNRRAQVGSEMTINNVSAFISISHHFIHLITMGAFQFLLHVSIKSSDKVLMVVQFCGTNISATKWSYEFQVYNKNEPRRKYLYTDVCQSYLVPTNEMFKDGAVLPMVYASGFVNSDAFTYKVFIKKNDDNNDRDEKPRFRGRGRGRGFHKGSRPTSVNSNATN